MKKRTPDANTLFPVNQCVRNLRYKRTPLGMDAVSVDHETYDAIQRLAIDVFARCSNSGHGFADALAAVYLTGLENGLYEPVGYAPVGSED